MNWLWGYCHNTLRQRKITTVWYYLYVEYEKYNKPVNITKKKQTYRHREHNSGYHGGNRLFRGRELLCIK